jgi:CheY-like chemotaxis protein
VRDIGPVTVAVLNANDDVVELLRLVFEQRGYAVVSTHVDSIKRGEVDIGAFARQHRPAVVVYDIPPPYDRQWTFMTHMAAMPEFAGVPFVLTTTNERRLNEIIGTDTPVLEIVGKPYDLDQIVQAVEAATQSKG